MASIPVDLLPPVLVGTPALGGSAGDRPPAHRHFPLDLLALRPPPLDAIGAHYRRWGLISFGWTFSGVAAVSPQSDSRCSQSPPFSRRLRAQLARSVPTFCLTGFTREGAHRCQCHGLTTLPVDFVETVLSVFTSSSWVGSAGVKPPRRRLPLVNGFASDFAAAFTAHPSRPYLAPRSRRALC